MDIILNELPSEISHLFMVNEKFNSDKNDILDFCDSIQDVCDKFKENITIQDHQEADKPKVLV